MAALRFRSHIVLVVACLVLYIGAAAQVRGPGGSALYIAVAAVTRPVITAANWIGQGWSALADRRHTLTAARIELTDLRDESQRLRWRNQLMAAEIAALRDSSALVAAFPSFLDEAVVCQVTGRDLLTTHTIRLGCGSTVGIRLDAAVLAGVGVLGRVDRVGESSARVQLLTHPAAASAARISGFSGEFLMMGGSPPRLTGLPPFAGVPEGTPVLTTGSEGIYPPDLLLGTSTSLRSDHVFTVVDVALAADAAAIRAVLVLTPPETTEP